MYQQLRRPLLFLLVLILMATSMPPRPARASTHSDTLLSGQYESQYGGTTIMLKMCGQGASYRFRSELLPNYTQLWDGTYGAINGCLGFSYRAVVGAQPGSQFLLYSMVMDSPLSTADFMQRARADICTVNAPGAIACSRQPRTLPDGYIDQPTAGQTIHDNATVSGWAIDKAATGGTGVSEVQVYANAGSDILLGTATYGQARPDVASAYGDTRFTNSGFSLSFDSRGLPNGSVTIKVAMKSTESGQWNWKTQQITINNTGDIPPNIPTPLAPGNGAQLNTRTVTLQWQDTGDPDNQPRNYRDYSAEIRKSDNSWSMPLNWQTATSWTLTVPSDGTYVWHVQSGDGAVGSGWSADWSFTVQLPIPVTSLDVPYVDQVYAQQPPIWGSCGNNPKCFNYWNHCGPASVAMILSYEKKELRDVYNDRRPTLELVPQVKRPGQGGSDWGLMLATLKAKGLQAERKSAPSFEDIKRSIQNGHPVLMGIGQADHILVVIGFEGTDTVIVNDPYGAKSWWNDSSGKLTNAFRNNKWVPEPTTPQDKGKGKAYTYGSNKELSGVNAIFISGPAPTPHATSARIGSAGGTLVGDGAWMSFAPAVVSAQAAGAELTITHTPELTATHPTDELGYALSVFQLEAAGSDGQPVPEYSASFTATISLDPAVVDALGIEGGSLIADETTLATTNGKGLLPSWALFLAYWDQARQEWVRIPSARNLSTNEITAKSRQFTEYAVIAQPGWQVQLPLVQH